MQKRLIIGLLMLFAIPLGVVFGEEVETETPSWTPSEVAIELERAVHELEVNGGFFTQLQVWRMDDNASDVVYSVSTFEEISNDTGFGKSFRKHAQKRIVFSETESLFDKINSFEEKDKLAEEEVTYLYGLIALLVELVETH